MDNRVWSSGASASPPAAPASPSVGYPTAGDPLAATPATKGGAFWFHMIGEELRAVLTAAGITPSTANNAQLLEAIQRLIDAQAGNYALDTGAANAYVVALSPAITAYTDGMTVRVKAVNANTGASTLDAGAGVVALVNDVGGALANGDVPAASIFTATYITSANKFYITSMVQSQADSRYWLRSESALRSKVIETSCDVSITSNFSVTGVGFMPTAVLAFSTFGGSTKSGIWGFADSARAGTSILENPNMADVLTYSSNLLQYYDGTNTNNINVSSFDADGATFNRAKTGTPTGNIAIKLLFLR